MCFCNQFDWGHGRFDTRFQKFTHSLSHSHSNILIKTRIDEPRMQSTQFSNEKHFCYRPIFLGGRWCITQRASGNVRSTTAYLKSLHENKHVIDVAVVTVTASIRTDEENERRAIKWVVRTKIQLAWISNNVQTSQFFAELPQAKNATKCHCGQQKVESEIQSEASIIFN